MTKHAKGKWSKPKTEYIVLGVVAAAIAIKMARGNSGNPGPVKPPPPVKNDAPIPWYYPSYWYSKNEGYQNVSHYPNYYGSPNYASRDL